MTGRSVPSLRLLVALLALGLVAAACAGATEEPFMSGLAADDDGGDGGSGAAPEPDPDCDPDNPRPSLRPTAELDGSRDFDPGSYMAEIQARGVLRAGVGADTLLFGFLNPQSGDVEGFDVDIARLVAEAIFGDPNRIELIPVQSSERIERVVAGDVDLVIKTMTINCERWGSINFSSVYYEAGQRLLVGADSEVVTLDDLTDETICAVSGTTSLTNIEAAGVDTIEVLTWTDCLVAFQQGRAQGISTDDTILAGLAAQDPYAQVADGPAFSEEPYGIGLPPDRPEFTQFVNAVLEQARQDGTWQALYDRWLAATLGDQSGPPPAQYR